MLQIYLSDFFKVAPLCFSSFSEPLSSTFPCTISSIHHAAPFSCPPLSLVLLILCHLLPSSLSAICLHSVCASRKFPLHLWGELRFSLLCSCLVLLLYVFHAGKASSSCMQQGVCSVWGCPIRDPIVWCYNPPIQRDPLSIFLSLWLLFSFLRYKTFMPSFSLSLTTLSSFPSLTFLICLSDYYLSWHFPTSHALSRSPPPTLSLSHWHRHT